MPPIGLFYKIALQFMASENGNGGMYKRVEWMVAADPSILEFLHSARDAYGDPAIQSPATVAKNTGFSADHIQNRLHGPLKEHGLVEQTSRGYYRLSEKGDKLMSGDVRPESLNDEEDDSE